MLEICRHDLGAVIVEVAGEVVDGKAKLRAKVITGEGEHRRGQILIRSLKSVDELQWYAAFFKKLSGHGVLAVVTDLMLGGCEVEPATDARTPTFYVAESYGQDGPAFIRTALMVKAGEKVGSMVVLTPSTSEARPMAMLNVFDFGNRAGNVDVIPMADDVQMRALAFADGGMVLNETAPKGHLLAVAVNVVKEAK